jgi:hypothetical protein
MKTTIIQPTNNFFLSLFFHRVMRNTTYFLSVIASFLLAGSIELYSQQPQDVSQIKDGIVGLVGTTPRQGLGGIVVLLSPEIISQSAADRARAQGDPLRVIGYNVYRRTITESGAIGNTIRSIGGNDGWEKLNARPVTMAGTEGFRSKLGQDFFETYKYLVQGKAELEPQDVTPKQAAAKNFATPLQYWEFVSNVGSIEDFAPMFLNAASLPLLGIVYVDSSAVQGSVYEYEIAAVTLGGEGKHEARGRIQVGIQAPTLERKTIDEVKTDFKEGYANINWIYADDSKAYTFKVLRSENGGPFTEFTTIYAQTENIAYGDGITKNRLQMTLIDSTIQMEKFYQYKVVPADYWFNDGTPEVSPKLLALDRKQLPIIDKVNITSSNTALEVTWNENEKKSYYDKTIVYRAENPDRPFVAVDTLDFNGKYVETELVPNKFYYYKIQTQYVDGTLSNQSPYFHKWYEYMVPPKAVQSVQAETFGGIEMAERKANRGAKGQVVQEEPVQAEVKGGVTLQWSKPVSEMKSELYDPQAYFLERSTDGGKTFMPIGGRIEGMKFTDTTSYLDQYNELQYRVQAQGVSGVLGEISEAIRVLPPVVKRLEKPRETWSAYRTTEQKGVRIESGIKMEWYNFTKNIPHIKGYNIYRRELQQGTQEKTAIQGSEGEWNLLNAVPLTISEYEDKAAEPSKRYEYAYTTIDIREQESPLGESFVINPAPQIDPQGAKINLQPMNALVEYDGLEITIKWDPIIDGRLKGYSIVRAGANGQYEEVASVGSGSGSYRLTQEAQKIYRYKIIPVFDGVAGIPSEELVAIAYPK